MGGSHILPRTIQHQALSKYLFKEGGCSVMTSGVTLMDYEAILLG